MTTFACPAPHRCRTPQNHIGSVDLCAITRRVLDGGKVSTFPTLEIGIQTRSGKPRAVPAHQITCGFQEIRHFITQRQCCLFGDGPRPTSQCGEDQQRTIPGRSTSFTEFISVRLRYFNVTTITIGASRSVNRLYQPFCVKINEVLTHPYHTHQPRHVARPCGVGVEILLKSRRRVHSCGVEGTIRTLTVRR